ncbi:hypothetical protein BDN72DRAFT_905606 [Pluteus cervinus]|uniref:Uncharacterized protein n=1 Tax=Pluteus cervinus TaxID=181527 RepID=A0ACD3A338_9AGAR|nr:hypothetical protein BDN72DRAFT_905606 [Pluteus cervinus]
MSTRARQTVLQAKHRRYYEKNKIALREKSRLRMARIRASRRSQGANQISVVVLPNGGMLDRADSSDGHSCYGSDPNSAWGSVADDSDTESSPSDAEHTPEHAVEDARNLRLAPESQLDFLRATIKLVNEWLQEWGGLQSWDDYLDSRFIAARQSGNVDQWVKHVVEHADRGRLYEKMLSQMESTIPADMWKIRELWREQSECIKVVATALALIRLRVNLVHRNPFNLLGIP